MNEILEDVESLDEVELDLKDRLVTKKSEEHLTTIRSLELQFYFD
jgi:hypothetical protein